MGKFFGFLILVIGAALLLGNFGVIPQMSVGDLFTIGWPLILVYWGATGLWHGMRRGHGFWGNIWPVALLLVGVGFLLDNLQPSWLPVNIWSLFIPAAFIIVGLSILFGKKRSWKEFTGITYEWKDWKNDWKSHGGTDFIDGDELGPDTAASGKLRRISSAFGDIRVGGANWNLENCHIEMKAGSITVDLRDTPIPEGETTVIVECKAGDIDVILPPSLAVWVEAGVKMGDVRLFTQQNSGTGLLVYKSDNYDQAERKIKMRVAAKFGDVDVKQMG